MALAQVLTTELGFFGRKNRLGYKPCPATTEPPGIKWCYWFNLPAAFSTGMSINNVLLMQVFKIEQSSILLGQVLPVPVNELDGFFLTSIACSGPALPGVPQVLQAVFSGTRNACLLEVVLSLCPFMIKPGLFHYTQNLMLALFWFSNSHIHIEQHGVLMTRASVFCSGELQSDHCFSCLFFKSIILASPFEKFFAQLSESPVIGSI